MFLSKNSTTIPFLWGAATSSHQVEGKNYHNDWWQWESAGKVPASGEACSHYELFETDFDIAKDLGHNAHRFSVEWSRIEPEEGRWNDEAINHYRQVIQSLRERQIEPVVTLHHFTNPDWFVKRGGWVRQDAPDYFERYVDRIVRACGEDVRFWITINEPIVYLYHSYHLGIWPPGHKSLPEAMVVFRNLLLAHMRAYRLIHKIASSYLPVKPAFVSFAKHMMAFAPSRMSHPEDHVSVWLRGWFLNDLFLKASMTGFLYFPGLFCEFLPDARCLDFVALNYYTRQFIRFGGMSIAGFLGEQDEDQTEGPKNDLGWEIYPKGLAKILEKLGKTQLPILITENGIATDDDELRKTFIRDHLAEALKFKDRGGSLLGYLHWSLIDNYEWDKGFPPRFGLVEFDPQNFRRKVKPSAYVLSQTCRNIA